jgi:predicted 3-demethylubiquinone-9 3-methyltransferase (glyoxalase superfamily)
MSDDGLHAHTKEDTMKPIMPCLWFDGKAEEAARFYTSIFKDSKITDIAHYGPSASGASGMPKGSVMTVIFEINGQAFMGLNGGPNFKFTEAVSFVVLCKNQEEIDEYWSKLTQGGEPGVCGWLKDKYGLSWQIAPASMDKWLNDKDPERSDRAMAALIQMKKLDMKVLEDAYEGKMGVGTR